MHAVDEIRVEELPDRGDAASNPYVLAVGGVLGLPQRLLGVASRKWNVVSASVKLGRSMVGEDEHGGVEGRVVAPPPLPVEVLPRARCGPNLLRPMISAPMFLVKSRVK